jgi:hypothetical protein
MYVQPPLMSLPSALTIIREELHYSLDPIYDMTEFPAPVELLCCTSVEFENPKSGISVVENRSTTSTPSVGDLSLYANPSIDSNHILAPTPHVVGWVLPPAESYIVRGSTHIDNHDLTWQLRLSEGHSEGSQHSPHMWQGSHYRDLSLPVMDRHVPQAIFDATSTLPQSGPDWNYSYYSPDVNFKPSDIVDDVADTDLESDVTEHESSSYSRPKRSRSNLASLAQLQKWTKPIDLFRYPLSRGYVCRCDQTFVRPEHLRRHIETVHTDQRDYWCKVPQCGKAFTRSDNMRDHYWTHIYLAGRRRGKNAKMSLAELKGILGPHEKRLIGKLRTRLAKHEEKKAKLAKRGEKKAKLSGECIRCLE